MQTLSMCKFMGLKSLTLPWEALALNLQIREIKELFKIWEENTDFGNKYSLPECVSAPFCLWQILLRKVLNSLRNVCASSGGSKKSGTTVWRQLGVQLGSGQGSTWHPRLGKTALETVSGPVSETSAWCQTTTGLVAPALPCPAREDLPEGFRSNCVLLDFTSF